VANRPKNIRIHQAVSRVRFYLLRFNSSGDFCDGRAISWPNDKRFSSDENRLIWFCRVNKVREVFLLATDNFKDSRLAPL
jgi:hypothetical protein